MADFLGLNPYYSGSCSGSRNTEIRGGRPKSVLILIIVEVALEAGFGISIDLGQYKS